jgi:hypothetical protein
MCDAITLTVLEQGCYAVSQRVSLFATAGIAALASCSQTQTVTPDCGLPPTSLSTLTLAYPLPNARAVPATLGSIIFIDQGLVASASVTVTSSHGTLPFVQFTSAPSPLPSPIAPLNPSDPSSTSYIALPVPVLKAHTRYTVHFSEPVWADNPPVCATTETEILGAFTTN